MPAPTVRPLNPDQLALLEALSADPNTAMCPICGARGFWDNRTGKKNPKSPDYKCKNKSCVGATPMKGKQPFAVWIPDTYQQAAPAPSRPSPRVPSPYAPPSAELPGHDPEAPPPDDAPVAGQPEAKEAAYYALARRVAAFQAEMGREHECPFDLASINAMTFSIWNSR